MIILFDLWVLGQEQMKHTSFEEELVLKTIFNFVCDRIILLEKEIDQEEEGRKEGDCCIMIEIIRKRISFNGYSEKLTEKLKNCFTKNDSEILALRFDEAFSYLN
jgi:hypothetical protein